MTYDMVMMLMGWPYDSFDCLLSEIISILLHFSSSTKSIYSKTFQLNVKYYLHKSILSSSLPHPLHHLLILHLFTPQHPWPPTSPHPIIHDPLLLSIQSSMIPYFSPSNHSWPPTSLHPIIHDPLLLSIQTFTPLFDLPLHPLPLSPHSTPQIGVTAALINTNLRLSSLTHCITVGNCKVGGTHCPGTNRLGIGL